ncbi:MAG: radical SAM protein, partial [Nitrospirae bacterium]|nr:radical SAM protein [Nitrospirota bacterium]
EHGCRYCYARFMMKFTGHTEKWGSFVDVKVNGPEVLLRQIRKTKPGSVFVSSVCDGWQPLEKRYQLTRRCIETLLKYKYPLIILTKSSLVERDISLLSGSKVEFGVTITTLNETLRKTFEPKASPSEERLRVLEIAKRNGINSYVFLGPLIPYFSDSEEDLSRTMKAIADLKPAYMYVDRLNLRWGVWDSLKKTLNDSRLKVYGFSSNDLREKYQRILFESRWSDSYSRELKKNVIRIAGKYGLNGKLRFCF